MFRFSNLNRNFQTKHFTFFQSNVHSKRFSSLPKTCDVAIIGGGVVGSSAAYWLAKSQPGLSVVVFEPDPTHRSSAASLSIGGIRTQFSTPENIQISQFSCDFVKNVNDYLSFEDPKTGEIEKVDVNWHEGGYLYLTTEKTMNVLQSNNLIQKQQGASVDLLEPDQLKERFPFLYVDDLALGSHGVNGEGWVDPYSLLVAFRKKAMSLGVTFFPARVISLSLDQYQHKVTSLSYYGPTLGTDSLETISAHSIINTAGIYGYQLSESIGLKVPVRPRKRLVFNFLIEKPLNPMATDYCPLVIDPSGLYFRPSDDRRGMAFLTGISPSEENDPDTFDTEIDYNVFDQLWETLAHRVPGCFDAIKLNQAWAGHYDYNTFDQNLIIGGDKSLASNFFIATGFSGHGLQQSPTVGRALSELVLYSKFTTLDLSIFGYERIAMNKPVIEKCVI